MHHNEHPGSKLPLYQIIAQRLETIARCQETGNLEWRTKHARSLELLCRGCLPSGSGIDEGARLLAESTPRKLIFQSDFHHMNENGFYVGWTDHKVIVSPSLSFGFDLKVTGRDRNEIKDYLHDVWNHALRAEVDTYLGYEDEQEGKD